MASHKVQQGQIDLLGILQPKVAHVVVKVTDFHFPAGEEIQDIIPE